MNRAKMLIERVGKLMTDAEALERLEWLYQCAHLEPAKVVTENDRNALNMAIAALYDQQGYSPADQPPPNRFLAQTKWGSVVLVERRSWGDPDWLVGGLYIPKDITWWWPLPEPSGGTE